VPCFPGAGALHGWTVQGPMKYFAQATLLCTTIALTQWQWGCDGQLQAW